MRNSLIHRALDLTFERLLTSIKVTIDVDRILRKNIDLDRELKFFSKNSIIAQIKVESNDVFP